MVLAPVVWHNPEILGGTPVFAGTRVPSQILLDDLAAGQALGALLDDFPSVEDTRPAHRRAHRGHVAGREPLGAVLLEVIRWRRASR